MRTASRMRLSALIVVLCLVLIFSLSLGYILIHAEHHCTDEHCPICEHIAVCIHTIQHLCDEWLPIILIVVLGVRIASLKVTGEFFYVKRMTPVLRHNRINC